MADVVVTPSGVLEGTNAQVASGIATPAITQGQAVVDTNGVITLAVNSANAYSGIAINEVAAGQRVSYQKGGTIDPGATLTEGTVYGLADSAGAFGPIADLLTGDNLIVMGVGNAAGDLVMHTWLTGQTIP